jgi:hypothetical protein
MASSSNHCQPPLTFDHHRKNRTIVVGALPRYRPHMRFEKVWVEQCRTTKAIKRRFGAKSALDLT